jgi:hypothetical protein
MLDGDEVARNGDPLDPVDDFDPDRDGLTDDEEAAAGSDPDVADGDGLSDGDEVHTYSTDPTNTDTDGGVPDGEEVDRGTDPLDPSDDAIDLVYKGGCGGADHTGGLGSGVGALLLAMGLPRRRT